MKRVFLIVFYPLKRDWLEYDSATGRGYCKVCSTPQKKWLFENKKCTITNHPKRVIHQKNLSKPVEAADSFDEQAATALRSFTQRVG